MRYLYLLRHAKSSWDEADLPDHERPLAARGLRDAKNMADHLRDRGVAPELVLCSSSRRTVATLKPIRKALKLDGDRCLIEDGLYAADAERLLRRLRDVPDDIGSVLLLAHAPGIQDLTIELVGQSGDPLLRRVVEKFPTGAVAALEVRGGTWRSLEPADANLVDFTVPRELSASSG